ncbi:MAG: hypothetical protein V7L04_10050 [Nostoc sp.]|uniref:hypothetical protein n=1 Tax=Nostoc sp. TaxID=1180 RepID=UPI002FF7681A
MNKPTDSDKKLHPQRDGVFGHWEWGTCTERCRSMGHGEESPMPNAQCPMPNAQCPKSAGGYPSPLTLGLEFPADFQ